MVAPVIPGLNDAELEALLARGARRRRDRRRATSCCACRARSRASSANGWPRPIPDRAAKVMKQVRALHGGRDYDAAWGKRMTGEGVEADADRPPLRARRRPPRPRPHAAAARRQPLPPAGPRRRPARAVLTPRAQRRATDRTRRKTLAVPSSRSSRRRHRGGGRIGASLRPGAPGLTPNSPEPAKRPHDPPDPDPPHPAPRRRRLRARGAARRPRRSPRRRAHPHRADPVALWRRCAGQGSRPPACRCCSSPRASPTRASAGPATRWRTASRRRWSTTAWRSCARALVERRAGDHADPQPRIRRDRQRRPDQGAARSTTAPTVTISPDAIWHRPACRRSTRPWR